MTAFAMAASAALLFGSRSSGGAVAWVIGVLLLAFCAFVGVMLFLVSTRLQAMFFGLLEKVPLPQKARIRGVVEQLVIDAHDRHVLAPVAALSLTVQLLRVLVHVLCAAALGVLSLSTVHYFFIFVPILAMTMLAPLPFGVREGIEGALFSLAGFKVEAAVVMGFLASLVGIAVSLLGAGFFLLGKRNLVGNRT
jgi:hypothetical protein